MKTRGAIAEHTLSAHAGFRSARSTALVLGVTLALLVALLQPAFAQALALPRGVALLVVGGFLLVVGAATAAHGLGGFESRVYQALNALENAWCSVGSLVLVFASAHHGYFFWTVYIAICVQTGSIAHNQRFNGTLFILAPLTLAGAFVLVRGDWVAAQITVLTAFVAFAAWATTLRSTRHMTERLAAKRLLEERERDLAVLRDRERIARDLHDGLGAVLTGLLYRVQDTQTEASLDGDEVESRVRECIEELRSAVWVLRDDSRSFEELMAWLRTRCADLCVNNVELSFDAPHPALPLDGALQLHLVRMVLEAVRNAVRHGRARHIHVSIHVADEIRVVVKDDGTGFDDDKLRRDSGGLANLRTRSSSLGGTLSIVTSTRGTELRFQCRAEQQPGL